MPQLTMQQKIQLMERFKASIFNFAFDIWHLEPQRVKPEYESLLLECRKTGEYEPMRLHHFEPFLKGRHITRQQTEFFMSIDDAIHGRGHRKISITSGHGIGKTGALSIVILYILCCWADSVVPCTAPTQSTLRDVLRKELSLWLRKMPDAISSQFQYSADYIRSIHRPNEWFARAKTGTKDSPEALAGVHSENGFVALMIDEASGVWDGVFDVAKGALTNKDTLLVMISNPTRNEGYFYESHHKLADSFRTLHFNSEHSPLVDYSFVQDVIRQHGQDSEEYNIRVKGVFPSIEGQDDGGYVPLIPQIHIRQCMDFDMDGTCALGVDPSGEGDDLTTWVLRNQFKARVLAKEKISTGKTIAARTLEYQKDFGLRDEHIVVDNFGVGVDTVKELALAGHNIFDIYLGAVSGDNTVYLNKRAELYRLCRKWLAEGGELVRHPGRQELLVIKYKRVEQRNLIQIEPKERMRKRGIKSPNFADGLSLTFAVDLTQYSNQPLLCNWTNNESSSNSASILAAKYKDFAAGRLW